MYKLEQVKYPESWSKIPIGENTPENRRKWPNYKNHGGAGPCQYCGEDSPWFTCRHCGATTCRSHHLAFIDRGAPVAYCMMCPKAEIPKKYLEALERKSLARREQNEKP